MSRIVVHCLILCATLIHAHAGCAQISSDSLWVRGAVTVANDYITTEMGWSLDGQMPGTGSDTLWSKVSRLSELTAWARNDSTQVQMEYSWPKWADSIGFVMLLNYDGLNLSIREDTLTEPWKPRNSGCFPATSVRCLENILDAMSTTPFEAQQHQKAMLWMRGQCLTIPSLRRLADGFDDERRRLSLLQSAHTTHPEALMSLGSLFFTTRYQEEFAQWLQQRPTGN